MLVLTKNGEIIEQDRYVLESISSRGNGRYGLQLNPYALSGVKVNYPKEIKSKDVAALFHNLPDCFEIRGEAVIPKNEHTYKKYGREAVWRNIASGMFNRIVPFNLEGVISYITDGKETIESLTNNDSNCFVLKPEFNGRKCLNPEIYNNVKLILSLFEDREDYIPFEKGDYLKICWDKTVAHMDKNGEYKNRYTDDGEELDIVMYSMSLNKSNIDINDLVYGENEEIFNSLGFKTIREVEFQKSIDYHLRAVGYGPTFRITSNKELIHNAVNEFYGILPETNKRCTEFPRLRNMYEYACDGVVIKPVGSNEYTQNVDLRLGRNNKIVSPEYPEDQIAIKLLSEIVRVKLDHIKYNKTKIGNITCTGVLDKAYRTESGAMVSSVNLHNPEWLSNHSWIKEGKEFDMCMSLDMIPVLMNPNL